MLTINKKDINMLQNYKSWLISKGYSKTTCVDYISCIKRIARWHEKTPEQLAESISDILPQYLAGGNLAARGKLKSRAIRSSFAAYNRYLLESVAA